MWYNPGDFWSFFLQFKGNVPKGRGTCLRLTQFIYPIQVFFVCDPIVILLWLHPKAGNMNMETISQTSHSPVHQTAHCTMMRHALIYQRTIGEVDASLRVRVWQGMSFNGYDLDWVSRYGFLRTSWQGCDLTSSRCQTIINTVLISVVI